MADEVKFTLNGLDDAVRKLQLLPDRFAYRGMRRSLRKGAVVVRDTARNNARMIDDPKTRNSIQKNITIRQGKARSERKEGGPIAKIGVAGGSRNMSKYGEFKGSGKGNPGGDTWYWRLIEFGFTDRGGNAVPARPFMRSAMAQSADKAISAIVSSASSELDKEIAKLNSGGG